MAFRPEPDTALADWWLVPAPGEPDPWIRLTHGPPGYPAYVRVRHHDDATPERPWVLALVAELLAPATTTPHDAVVAQWDGHFGGGGTLRRDAAGRWVEHPEPFVFDDAVMAVPRAAFRDHGHVVRRYLLLRGDLRELGRWPARPGEEPPDLPELVCGATWPADHAWCHVWEVDDDHGATVACDEELAAALLADGRYAAWRVERGEPDPPERLRPA